MFRDRFKADVVRVFSVTNGIEELSVIGAGFHDVSFPPGAYQRGTHKEPVGDALSPAGYASGRHDKARWSASVWGNGFPFPCSVCIPPP